MAKSPRPNGATKIRGVVDPSRSCRSADGRTRLAAPVGNVVNRERSPVVTFSRTNTDFTACISSLAGVTYARPVNYACDDVRRICEEARANARADRRRTVRPENVGARILPGSHAASTPPLRPPRCIIRYSAVSARPSIRRSSRARLDCIGRCERGSEREMKRNRTDDETRFLKDKSGFTS